MIIKGEVHEICYVWFEWFVEVCDLFVLSIMVSTVSRIK